MTKGSLQGRSDHPDRDRTLGKRHGLEAETVEPARIGDSAVRIAGPQMVNQSPNPKWQAKPSHDDHHQEMESMRHIVFRCRFVLPASGTPGMLGSFHPALTLQVMSYNSPRDHPFAQSQ